MSDSQPLLDVAAALADGTPVDWESAANAVTTDEDRRLLEELRFIAGLVGTSPASAAPEPSPLPARSWGPLNILEHVGRGTFGDVYRAWDTRLDREVALKILRRRDHDDVHASTVIEEGRLLARVRHPNVVTVYGAERVGEQVGVWMEFIHGKTLEQELRERGSFSVDRVIQIGVDLADALATVHRAGMIHGDVKTHNVMCGPDGRTVLTDFGAGFELDETVDGGARDLAGTPVCVAPEVLAGLPATAASDVYSLGVLLYHLLTGAYPVRGRTLEAVREAHAQGTRTPLSAARPDLPAGFTRIVDRALDPDPQKRYDGPDALRTALAELAPGPRVERREPRGRFIVIAAGLVLAVGLAAAPLWWRSGTPTIAVLPFANQSTDPNNEFFVDGLTDEIIRNLSVIEGLDVRSRSSSFAFKGKTRNIPDVVRQLDVTHVLEGSVLRSGGQLRIIAALIRTADNVPVWSQKFERESRDIFAILDEISLSIVNAMRVNLGRGRRRYEANEEAYELYLRARANADPVGPARARVAAGLFEQVIAKDPAFAPAYAGLAEAWAAISVGRGEASEAPDRAFAIMQPAAEKALQLDPRLAEAHAALGVVRSRERNWKEAEAAFHRAIDLNPSLSSVRMNFVQSTLWQQGKVDESLRQNRAALRSDPLSLDVQRQLAHLLVSAERYDESLEIGRRVLAAEPDHVHARQVFARALFHKGDREEAIKRFEQLGTRSQNMLGYAYAASGRRAEAEAIAVERKNFPATVALVHAGLGNKDEAFKALERMADERDPRVGQYLTYPELAGLRGDPRMEALRRTLAQPYAAKK